MVDLYGIHGSVNIPYVLIVCDSVWVNTNNTSRGDFLREGYVQYGHGDVRMSQWVYYAVGSGPVVISSQRRKDDCKYQIVFRCILR